jgi:hypothetical protein
MQKKVRFLRCKILTLAPVVSSTTSVSGHEEVFGVIQVSIEPVLDTVDDARLQINEKCARDVMLVVSLVEEDIFAIISLSRILFKYSISADTVLHAELLPKLVSNCDRQ